MDFKDIARLLQSLSPADRKKVHLMLSREFDAAESAASRLIEEIREQKHKTGFTCPRCGHNKAIRNGTFQSPYGGSRVTRQRYLCKQCGKTFNDLTGTPMHRSRNKELWVSCIELMLEGHSLRKCAGILGVRHERLFYWRHKVLTALKKMESVPPFEGIVEMDETYFACSEKGSRKVEKLRKRGGVSKRGISDQLVCVLVVQDRTKQTFSKAICRGRILTRHLEEHIASRISRQNILCTDAWRAFKTFASQRGIAHYRFKSTESKRVKGVYHIQNVNNYHSLYKRWLSRFAGVASKYMDNYLAWFKFLQENKELSRQALIRSMFVAACTPSTFETETSLRRAQFAT
jgi:transposase-like protein